jgi:hypothetical protein
MARIIAVAGWLAGMILILAGWTLPAVLAVVAGTGTAAFAVLRWGRGTLARLKVTVQLRRSPKKAVSAIERA